MKLKLFFLFIFIFNAFLIFSQSTLGNEIDQVFLNARIGRMLSLLLDTTNEKFNGFDRIDVNMYLEKGINDDTFFMTFRIKENIITQINDAKLFPNGDFINKRKCYGAYLTAFEKQGFFLKKNKR